MYWVDHSSPMSPNCNYDTANGGDADDNSNSENDYNAKMMMATTITEEACPRAEEVFCDIFYVRYSAREKRAPLVKGQ